jgi:lysophospholipase L1-like esterase
MSLARNSRIVMTGDSITDCGRARPVGDSRAGTLGDGYVSIVDRVLAAVRPEMQLHVLNTGMSGNTVRELRARWREDVMALKPDWLSVMIGINDVWRQFDTDPALLRPVCVAEYRLTLEALLNEARGVAKGVIVMLPFYLEAATHDPMRAMRDVYADAARQVAANVGAIVVDTQAAFNAVLPHRGRETLAPDGVHPTPLGHMILAMAWLKAIGLQW